MTGKRDDGNEGGMDRRRGEEAEINAAKARPVRGAENRPAMLTLIPLGRAVNTQEERTRD